MNDLRTAAQQALEALEYAQQGRECPSTTRQAITALRDALAQQAEPVEPVPAAVVATQSDVWRGYNGQWAPPGEPTKMAMLLRDLLTGTLLYTAPPQRQPLTEKEMYIVEEEARKNFRLAQAGPRGQMITYWDSLTPWLIRAVERAHGIKE